MKKLAYLTLAIMIMASFTLMVAPQAAAQTTWTVDDDLGADFITIQEAIDAAAPGDTIMVAEGTYYENLEWYTNLTIIGAGTSTTIIDGDESGSVFNVDSIDNSRLEGFTIQSGSATSGGGMNIVGEIGDFIVKNCSFEDNDAEYGGGVFYEEGGFSPTFINCTFIGNNAYCGGGMLTRGVTHLTDCRFTGNEAAVRGGGMQIGCEADVSMQGCVFEGNSAGCSGGGIRVLGHATLTDCTFDGNQAEFMGGGVKVGCEGDLELEGCTFNGNEAGLDGGALAVHGGCARANVNSCLFTNNSAFDFGGGIFTSYSTECGGATITNSVLFENMASAGGGIFAADTATITNCTFVYNLAYGMGGSVLGAAAFPSPSAAYAPSPVASGSCCCGQRSAAAAFPSVAYAAPSDLVVSGSYCGGGLYDESYASPVTNCIFWGNYGYDENDQIFPPSMGSLPPTPTPPPTTPPPTSLAQESIAMPTGNGGGTSVTYSDVMGGYEGTGNISGTPMFVNPGSEDFHLQGSSPCIDKGTGGAPGLPDNDVDEQERIMGGSPDIGADEYEQYGGGFGPTVGGKVMLINKSVLAMQLMRLPMGLMLGFVF